MIEILLIAYAATWLFTEAKYATMGKPSPRMQLKMQREGRGQYSLGMWASDFAGDFLKDVTAKRRELQAEKAERRREAREELAEMRQAERRQRQGASLDAAVDEAVALTAAEDGGDSVVHNSPEYGRYVRCATCGQDGVPAPASWRPGMPIHCARCSAVTEKREAPTLATLATGPDAQIISITKKTEKGTPVSYDEGQFLTSAIAHCKAVSAAHVNHTEGGAGEDFATGLAGGGVKGEQLAAVHAAMEASANAAVAWDAAAQKIGEGLQVKEAYENAPDTGDRAYVTGGE